MSDSQLHCARCYKLTNLLIKVEDKKMTISCTDCKHVHSIFSTQLLDRLDTLESNSTQLLDRLDLLETNMGEIENSLIGHKNLFGSIMDQFQEIAKDLRDFDTRLVKKEIGPWIRVKNLFKKK